MCFTPLPPPTAPCRSQVVPRVRAECAELGIPSLAVMVDVLADAFSINEVYCALLFLRAVDNTTHLLLYYDGYCEQKQLCCTGIA